MTKVPTVSTVAKTVPVVSNEPLVSLDWTKSVECPLRHFGTVGTLGYYRP